MDFIWSLSSQQGNNEPASGIAYLIMQLHLTVRKCRSKIIVRESIKHAHRGYTYMQGGGNSWETGTNEHTKKKKKNITSLDKIFTDVKKMCYN